MPRESCELEGELFNYYLAQVSVLNEIVRRNVMRGYTGIHLDNSKPQYDFSVRYKAGYEKQLMGDVRQTYERLIEHRTSHGCS
jgi:hypothetical protein